jgi:hypothetical protein
MARAPPPHMGGSADPDLGSRPHTTLPDAAPQPLWLAHTTCDQARVGRMIAFEYGLCDEGFTSEECADGHGACCSCVSSSFM